MTQSLYAKYTIIKNETGEEVRDAFVLKPETDPIARLALSSYAEFVRDENPLLAADIDNWLRGIYSRLGGAS